jgi:hypothetical protein
MSAGTIIFILIVSAALLFVFRAGVIAIMSALDRLTASVTAATAALAAATAGTKPSTPTDEAALNTLADSLDQAVAGYNAAVAAGETQGEDDSGNDAGSGTGNPLAPNA